MRKDGSVGNYACRPVSKNYVLKGIILAYAHRPVSKNWGAKAYKLHTYTTYTYSKHVTAGLEATADSWFPEVEALLTLLLACSRASLCLASLVLHWLGESKQSQRSPSCPHA